MRPDDLRNPECSSCYLLAAWETASGPEAFVELNGRFLIVNRAWGRMFGRAPSEFPSLAWRDVTHPDDVGVDQAEVDRLLRGEGEPYYELPKRYIHKNGAVFRVRLCVSLVPKVDGSPWFFWVSAFKQTVLAENRARLARTGFGKEVYRRAAEDLTSAVDTIKGYLDDKRGKSDAG